MSSAPRVRVLVLLASAAAVPPAAGQINPAAPAGIKPPSVVALPPGLVQRLAAAGIDSSAPDLTSKLKSRLRTAGAGSTRGTVKGDIVRGGPKYGDQSLPAKPSAPAGKGRSAPSGPPSLVIEALQLSPWDLHTALLAKGPKSFGASDVSYKVAGPCGLSYAGALESDGGPFGCCYPDPSGAEKMFLRDYANHADKWRLGGTPQTISVTFSISGLPDATRSVPGVVGAGQQVKVTLTIGSEAPLLGGNDAGLQANHASFGGSVPRSNDGAPWVTTTGQDTIGLGVYLGKGYTVTQTRIVAAYSTLDAPGSNPPENAYRYAKVKTPPDSGRLQTVVDWMYGPGESLSYQIEWTLTGPLGQRPLLTMPPSGPCDS